MPLKKVELKDIIRDLAFLPGYTGYLPGYHLVYGTSTGQHSNNHLTRAWNAGGANAVQTLLSPLEYTAENKRAAEEKEQHDECVLKAHSHLQGGLPKFTDHVDPKYTGYFPYQQHRFGARNSIRTREGALQMLGSLNNTCEPLERDRCSGSCPPRAPADLHLPSAKPIPNPTYAKDYGWGLNNIKTRDDMEDFYVDEVDKALTKPYRLPPDHKLKRFPYGYTGWLPFTTEPEHVGLTHGELSKVCLQDLDKNLVGMDIFRTSPAGFKPASHFLEDDIERVVHGIPGYTGYKERTRYRHGYTHAKEMKDVMKLRHPWLTDKLINSLSTTLGPLLPPVSKSVVIDSPNHAP